jgi:hypothetical protein
MTDDQIKDLRERAVQCGDLAMALICDQALDTVDPGASRALVKCERVFAEDEAMHGR